MVRRFNRRQQKGLLFVLFAVRSSGWHCWYNDYQTTRYSGNGMYPVNTDQEQRIVRETMSRDDTILLAVLAIEKDVVVGNINLSRVNQLHRNAEISVMIGHPEYRGRTAGLEAIGLTLQHGFDRLDLHRIYGGSHIGLSRFVHIVQILGFTDEGVAREAFLRDNAYHDVMKYAVLQPAYDGLEEQAAREVHIFRPRTIGRGNPPSR